MAEEEEPDSNPEKKHRRRRRRRSSRRQRHNDDSIQQDSDVPRWKINFAKGFFIFNGIIGILIPWAYTFYRKHF